MNDLKYDEKGLIPVVVQDWITNEVLMVAWANEEAVSKMYETGYTHFWSRSRQKLWKKGEESGHLQKIKSIQKDCDADTLLVRVEQVGGIACHLNKPSEDEMCGELADLIYHTMVAVEKMGVPMEKVYRELWERSQ